MRFDAGFRGHSVFYRLLADMGHRYALCALRHTFADLEPLEENSSDA